MKCNPCTCSRPHPPDTTSPPARLCRTCRYWEGATCHRYPPSVDPATDNAFWPSTCGPDWCGEHEYSAEAAHKDIRPDPPPHGEFG